MKKYKEVIEKIIKERVEYGVANCIVCNSDDITLFNKQPANGWILGGHCNKCNNHYQENHDNGKFKCEAAAVWNRKNDVKVLIAQQQINIKMANDEIKRLTELAKERKNETIKD